VVWDDLEAPPAKTPRRFVRMQKPTLCEGIVIVMILVVLAGLVLPCGDQDTTHRYPEPVPNAGNGFAAVAGEYDQGASRGRYWRLSLLSDGRYSFVWSGCTGVHHRESGSVNRVEGHLVLWPIEPIEPRMKRVLLPVKWGRRSYLIPADRLREFCDAIIGGDEPRNSPAGQFYLIGFDQRVDGIPELPERWANHLKDNLVIGTIVGVREGGRARLDVGSSEGLRVGSMLTVRGGNRFGSRKLRAISVREGSCEVKEAAPGDFKEPIEVGWEVVAAREAGGPRSP